MHEHWISCCVPCLVSCGHSECTPTSHVCITGDNEMFLIGSDTFSDTVAVLAMQIMLQAMCFLWVFLVWGLVSYILSFKYHWQRRSHGVTSRDKEAINHNLKPFHQMLCSKLLHCETSWHHPAPPRSVHNRTIMLAQSYNKGGCMVEWKRRLNCETSRDSNLRLERRPSH
jgi:hypothetical protein